MRIVKIFIASSEELTPERRVLADMQAMLNNRLFKQGVILQLEFWEHLDSSMNIKEKQEEYNDVLRECDGCIALFWIKFGEFTKKELEVAYRGVSGDGNPKQLCVLFKNTTDQTPDLKIFKDGFVANYGDISSTFSTNDELRLALIEQVETILADGLEAPLYSIGEDNKVVIGGAVMDKIKVLNVYIAMADDVEVEQNEFMDLVSHINKIFIRRNMCLNIIKHKQNMGNLRECELCMTLYCAKFGDYTKTDLEGAYKELQEGNNPRKLYVFFKNSDNITPELQQFKESFVTKYGHFFCKFENVDTMRLEFLLQLEAYQNNHSDELLKVENQKVVVDGAPIVDLNNVPFASMNKEFVRLRDGIDKIIQRIERCRKRLSKNPNDEDSQVELNEYLIERNKMQEEFNQHQRFIFDMARKISQLSSQRLSKRSSDAIRLFQMGDAAGANAVLNTDNLLSDTEQSFKDYDHYAALATEANERIVIIYRDWRLKVDAIISDESIYIDKRIEQAHNAYNKAIDCAKKINYPQCNAVEYLKLLYDFNLFLSRYGMYDIALKVCEEHLELSKIKYDSSHLSLADSYNALGLVYANKGDDVCALECYDQVLKIRLSNPNTSKGQLATCFNNLGASYDNNGEVAKGLEYYKKSLDILLDYSGENSLPVATSYNNIGYAYYKLEDFAQALENFTKSLQIREQFADKSIDDLISIARSYNNIGGVYYQMQNYEQALYYTQKELVINEQRLGAKHQFIIDALNNKMKTCNIIGTQYCRQGKFDEAFECFILELEAAKRLYVDDKEGGISIISNIIDACCDCANELYNNNKLDEAFKCYTEIKNKIGNSAYDPNIITVYLHIGIILGIREEYEGSTEYLLKVITIMESSPEIDPTGIVPVYELIGHMYKRIPKYETSLVYYQRVLDIRSSTRDINNIDLAQSYFNIGDLYIDMQDYDNAIEYMHKSLDSRIKELGGCCEDVAICYNHIGYIYNETGNYNEALRVHTKACKIREEVFGCNAIETAYSYNNLGKTYTYLGNYTTALEWLNKALSIRERELDAEHEDTIATQEQIEIARGKLNSITSEQSAVPMKPSLFTKVKNFFYQ